jgi:hypothetical protein
VSEAREGSAAIISTVEEREKLLTDMASGKTDIAAWMRSQTDYALVPAGAVYCDKCSQALIYEYGAPTATFTFDKESPYRGLVRRAVSGDEAARDEFFTRRGEEEMKGRTATQQAMNDFVAVVVAFYRDRGFIESEGDHSIIVTFLQSPDERVSVAIWEANPYCGLLPRNIIAPCAAVSTGPFVELGFEESLISLPAKYSEKTAGAAAEETGEAAKTPAEGTPAADEKADAAYEGVRNALLMAHLDAANPEALEFPIPPDAPVEVKAEIASIAAEFAVRKANMLVYKRHEAELAPILDALLELSDE